MRARLAGALFSLQRRPESLQAFKPLSKAFGRIAIRLFAFTPVNCDLKHHRRLFPSVLAHQTQGYRFPATPRHTMPPLRLLPSGPDQVHG